jgi:hypothetical protein
MVTIQRWTKEIKLRQHHYETRKKWNFPKSCDLIFKYGKDLHVYDSHKRTHEENPFALLQLHHFSIVPELKMQNSRNIARLISPPSFIRTQIRSVNVERRLEWIT